MALPQRILVIGSSSIGENGSGTLGKALKSLLDEHDLVFYGKSGAGFNTFAGTAAQKAALVDRIRTVAPQLVLVVMGGNPTGTAVQLGDMMTWFNDALGSIPLLWVGPPVYAGVAEQGVTKLYDNIGPRILGDRYVSSQGWTSPVFGRTSDKVHFTDYGAMQWGQKIVEWMRASMTPFGIVAIGWGLFAIGIAAVLFKRGRA